MIMLRLKLIALDDSKMPKLTIRAVRHECMDAIYPEFRKASHFKSSN